MTNKEIDALLDKLQVVEENKGLVVNILKYFARRSHQPQTQAALAAAYGALVIFGVRGSVLMFVAAVKAAKKPTAPKPVPTTAPSVNPVDEVLP